jgi:hypothetical protein
MGRLILLTMLAAAVVSCAHAPKPTVRQSSGRSVETFGLPGKGPVEAKVIVDNGQLKFAVVRDGKPVIESSPWHLLWTASTCAPASINRA